MHHRPALTFISLHEGHFVTEKNQEFICTEPDYLFLIAEDMPMQMFSTDGDRGYVERATIHDVTEVEAEKWLLNNKSTWQAVTE